MVLDKVPERTFVATYRFICRTANYLQPDRVYKYLVCLKKWVMECTFPEDLSVSFTESPEQPNVHKSPAFIWLPCHIFLLFVD